MQPIRRLEQTLAVLADRDRCVFSASDLVGAIPDSGGRISVLLSRATKAGLLKRVCRGIYYYPQRDYPIGNLLYHAAARLRSKEFQYLSLESVLSDHGVISQIPFQWITLMTSGRSNVIHCGDYGRIEFVHTAQTAREVAGNLTYHAERRLWSASVRQAMRDMKATQRSLDLVDREVLDELV